MTNNPAGQNGLIIGNDVFCAAIITSITVLWQQLTIGHGDIGIAAVGHGPVEHVIEGFQVSIVVRGLQGEPDPLLVPRPGEVEGQPLLARHQLSVVEDHQVSTGVEGALVHQAAAADTVLVPAHVSLQAVGGAEGPMPQENGEVPCDNVASVRVWTPPILTQKEHESDQAGDEEEEPQAE